jgi:hypothetical protein
VKQLAKLGVTRVDHCLENRDAQQIETSAANLDRLLD